MTTKKTTRKTAASSKAIVAKKVQKDKTEKEIAQISAEKIAQSFAKVSTDTAKQLSAINEVIQSELAKVDTASNAVQFKLEELEELHGKEVVLKSLDDLQIDFANKQDEFETSEEEARENWRKEQVGRDRALDDAKEELVKTRARDEAEYDYNVKNARRESQDKWAESVHSRQVAEKRRQEELSRDWDSRETEIAKKEEEVAAKQDLIQSFDARVTEAVDKAVKKAESSIYAKNSIQNSKVEAEYSMHSALSEQEIATLKKEADASSNRIQALETSLTNARVEQNEMAKAALEAQSQRAALEAVQAHAQTTSSKR